MTNDIETRYLIVTLPDTSGEEAESMVELIDTDVLTDGFTTLGTVEHALGLVIPDGIGCSFEDQGIRLQTGTGLDYDYLNPGEARALAGALLRAAGEAEVVHSTCAHCGRAIVMDHAGTWVCPEAGRDMNGDGIWRETCEANDTFAADHEPVAV